MIGGATAALTGGDVGLGAITGAISALTFFGVGEFVVPEVCSALGATTPLAKTAVTVGVHTAAGAVSGGVNSAITGSDIGLGMFTGAVGAGIGAATGGALRLLKVDQLGYQLVTRTVTGGIAGGIISRVYGGNFWEGFTRSATAAAIAFLFNEMLSQMLRGIYRVYARPVWKLVAEANTPAVGASVGGRPTAGGLIFCTCVWERVGFETVYEDASGRIVKTEPCDSVFEPGKIVSTSGRATQSGCLCPNPNGELQLK